MTKWRIAPIYKKSVREFEFWSRNGQTVQYSHLWSSGSITLVTATNSPPNIDLKNMGKEGLCVNDIEDGEEILEVEIDDFMGGDTDEWVALSDGVSEVELNEVRSAWDEDWSDGVENLGWNQEAAEVRFYGELSLEKLDE